MTKSLFALSVASLSACVAPPSEGPLFCDVARPIRLPVEVAQVVVRDARPEALTIAAHNATGERACRWQ